MIIEGGIVLLAGILTHKNINYKLLKNGSFRDYKVLKKPEIYKTVRKKNYNSNMTKEMQEIINKIYASFESVISNESMQIIKRNIESIKVNSDWIKSLNLCFKGAGGAYNPLSHSIKENYFLTKLNITNYIDGKNLFQKIISHELMHAASSFKNGRQIITGFCQCYIKPFMSVIGVGLNEGYTEVLSNRYIIDKNLIVNGKDTGYKYERAVAELVELIVGKDKMINMYFHGDLEGLINELSKYQNEMLVKEFILDLDTITKTYRDKTIIEKTNMINNLYNKINTFLYYSFSNKMNNSGTKEYLEESRKFLELFSKIENNYPTSKKSLHFSQKKVCK